MIGKEKVEPVADVAVLQNSWHQLHGVSQSRTPWLLKPVAGWKIFTP